MPISSPNVLTPIFEIKIGGSPASSEFMKQMTECVVENSLHLPDMCTIRVTDKDFKFIDDSTLAEGTAIEVSAGIDRQGNQQRIFKGEIVGMECDLAAHGVPTVMIRAFNKAHRLHQGRKTRTFLQVKDSDLASRMAGEAGLQAMVDDTSVMYEHVLQCNQTNWEFLSLRAVRAGCRLYSDGDKLYFKKVRTTGDGEVEVEWGENLISFRPHTAATPQVNKVIVRGWDPKKKQEIVAQVTISNAKSAPQVGDTVRPERAASAIGGSSSELVITDQPVYTVSEAQNIAQSVADSIAGDYLTAEGLCMGNAALRPGKVLKVTNVGTRFSGKYYVTATTHIYSPAEGYKTMFSVSGKHPNNLLGMMENGTQIPKSPQGGNIVIGIVTNNKPDGGDHLMGEIKVKYPWLGDNIESGWIRVSSQMAGSNRGMFSLPEINDEVLIAFEHGDVNRPYVIGQLWNGVDKMPSPETGTMVQDGKVERRGLYTREGHKIVFNDHGAKKGDITITTVNNHTLTMNDNDEMIEVTTKGNHKFTMHDKDKKVKVISTKGHKVEMDDSGDTITMADKNGNTITIASNGNKIDLKCMGNLTIEATGKVSISGTAGVEVKTPAMMTLEATGINTIKGALVKIN
ncbi:MAG: VgrG-related protein [Armatimonadota bacterium]